MPIKSLASGAVVLAALGAVPGRTQDAAPAVPPAVPELTEAEAGLAYEYAHFPFRTKFWSRMQYVYGLPQPEKLFTQYDPAVGLEKRAQTSRVARNGFRTEAFAPVMEVRAGETVGVPISVRGGVMMTAFRVYLEYNPEVLEPLGAEGVGIPTEDTGFNSNPDPAEVGEAVDRTVVALNVLATPWKANGPVLIMRFRALRPGESTLRASLAEVANNEFDLVPLVFRSGLIKVR